jgi:hypothetical protein
LLDDILRQFQGVFFLQFRYFLNQFFIHGVISPRISLLFP